MNKLLKNMYLIQCAISLSIGDYLLSNDFNKSSISMFSYAFLCAIFHLDYMINDKKN